MIHSLLRSCNLLRCYSPHFAFLKTLVFTMSTAGITSEVDDLEYGFKRSEMNSVSLAATVEFYERHVFLCYKSPKDWPSRVESEELPNRMASYLKSQKSKISRKIRFTVCEDKDDSETSDGDVFVFPDMIKFRGLNLSNVENFVDDVIINGSGVWASGKPETLKGTHVFICSHGTRDLRCGFCGPILIDKFKEEIKLQGMEGQVFVRPCSHIGGHKYAGNLIIFSSNTEGKTMGGHWYGYVTPEDVSSLLVQHIMKGEIVHRLWRGEMGLSEEEQMKIRDEILNRNENRITSEAPGKNQSDNVQINQNSSLDCCQGVNGFSCCKNEQVETGCIGRKRDETEKSHCGFSSWIGKWDQEHTFAALAIIGVVSSIGMAYSIYRKSV